MGVQENVGMVSSCARYFICHAEIRWMKQVQDIDDLLLIEITGLRIVNGQQPEIQASNTLMENGFIF